MTPASHPWRHGARDCLDGVHARLTSKIIREGRDAYIRAQHDKPVPIAVPYDEVFERLICRPGHR